MPDRPDRRSTQIAWLARGRPRWLAVALGALGGAALLMLAAGVFSHAGADADRSQRRAARPALASIPPAAQGAISAALGRGQPNYRVNGLRAQNSTQRFGASFSPGAVRIDSASAHVGFRLLGYGRTNAMRRAGPVRPRAS